MGSSVRRPDCFRNGQKSHCVTRSRGRLSLIGCLGFQVVDFGSDGSGAGECHEDGQHDEHRCDAKGHVDESDDAEDESDDVVLEMLESGCQLMVRQTIREIAGDDAGAFPPSLLPVGLYTVVERLSWKPGEAPEQLDEAFVRLRNGNWIRTRVRIAELNDPKVC